MRQHRCYLADGNVVEVMHDQHGPPRQWNAFQRRQHHRARLFRLERLVGPGPRIARLHDPERDLTVALALVRRRDPERDSEQVRPDRAILIVLASRIASAPGTPPGPDLRLPTMTCPAAVAFDRRSPAPSGTCPDRRRRTSCVVRAMEKACRWVTTTHSRFVGG